MHMTPNKSLEWTVMHKVPESPRQRAAAQLRRYVTKSGESVNLGVDPLNGPI